MRALGLQQYYELIESGVPLLFDLKNSRYCQKKEKQ